ncbi:FAD-dependent oxidoreductase [Nocardioides limicola]|uniref:FAD-dependent oxidoreductase n=1 Tax=Nocardioides limicola TaxID=2803368 RepID=UPI00193C48C7|nr:FAD-dependent oxidoreductase [Nocardioides sp. DJM-14]
MRIVIIGADAAGMSAAHQALRTARAVGREVSVLAFEAGDHTSYSACGIPYWLAGDVDSGAELVARTAREHRAAGIDLRMRTRVVAIDPTRRQVRSRDRAGIEETHEYDELVIATGAAPIIPDWAHDDTGALHEGFGVLHDLDDGARWAARLGAEPPPVVVAGGGYVGIEAAEAFVRRGCRVTLVTRGRVMSSLDPEMGARVAVGMAAAGVKVIEGAEVAGVARDGKGAVCGVSTSDGGSHHGLVTLALGVRPRTQLAVDAGIPVGQRGGLLADPTGRVAPGVWAAGDCTEVLHRLTGSPAFLPLGTHANKQGRVVGTNIVDDGQVRFGGALGTAITRFVTADVHLEIARTGLTLAQATELGLDAVALDTEGTTASRYMPEAADVAVRVVADRQDRRLLGVQIVGGPGAGKRIDTAAIALWGGMSVDEVAGADLSYAPPFATVWDILQIAVRRLAERL